LSKDLPRLIWCTQTVFCWHMSRFPLSVLLTSLILGSFLLAVTLLPSGSSIGSSWPWMLEWQRSFRPRTSHVSGDVASLLSSLVASHSSILTARLTPSSCCMQAWSRWRAYRGCCSLQGRSSNLSQDSEVKVAYSSNNSPYWMYVGVLLCDSKWVTTRWGLEKVVIYP